MRGVGAADHQNHNSVERRQIPVTESQDNPNVLEPYDYGPLQTFEITWMSNHVETVQGHQILWESHGEVFAHWSGRAPTEHPKMRIHAMLEGRRWTLVLQALESDIRTIRNVTADESVPQVGER